jgi:hypothetical protein
VLTVAGAALVIAVQLQRNCGSPLNAFLPSVPPVVSLWEITLIERNKWPWPFALIDILELRHNEIELDCGCRMLSVARISCKNAAKKLYLKRDRFQKKIVSTINIQPENWYAQ